MTPVWPEAPTCHNGVPRVLPDPVTWRPARADDDGPYVQTFRTCSYCGSIHPEDLLHLLERGATLGATDQKYGWPHKFYVHDIANPVAGKLRRVGSASLGALSKDMTLPRVQEQYPGYSNWRLDENGWQGDMICPAPATQQAKWYTTHLLDLTEETFALMAKVLAEKTQYEFRLDEGELSYRPAFRGAA